MKTYRFLILFLLLPGVIFAQERTELGARAIGMGNAFVGVSDDANALYWNPAGISMFTNYELNIDLARLHWGIEEELITHGGAAYIHHFGALGSLGIRGRFFSAELFRQFFLSLSYSRRIFGTTNSGLSLGLSAGILQDSYNTSRFSLEELNDPLIREATRPKTVPIIDAGLFWKHKEFAFGVSAKNINEPSVSVLAENTDKLPLQLFLGGSYKIRQNLISSVSFELRSDLKNNKRLVFYNLGVERWILNKALGIRGGLRAGELTGKATPQELTLGTSWVFRRMMRIDYAFCYPLTSLAGAGASTHRFSFLYEIVPPKKRFPDLFTDDSHIFSLARKLSVGDADTIVGYIKNIGEKGASGFYITVFVKGPKGEWSLLSEPELVREPVRVGDSIEVRIPWSPSEAGEYQFILRADDDGKMFPALHGRVKEIDEENNMASARAEAFSLPKATISLDPPKLTLKYTTTIIEEKPIVPVVFFEAGEYKVAERFSPMIETIASRLKNNPDARLELRGYYNPLSDSLTRINGSELALRRAEAVREAFLSVAPELAGRIEIVKSGYWAAEPRASSIYGVQTEKDRELVNEENRRVEISVSLLGEPSLQEITFPPGETLVTQSMINQLPVDTIKELLDRNPEFILYLEGLSGEGERKEGLGFARAWSVKNLLVSLLGPAYEKRIFVYENARQIPAVGVVRLSVLPEGIIFRPAESSAGIEEISLEHPTTTLKLEQNAKAGVKYYRVWVEDESGRVFVVLAQGEGTPPQTLVWNWTDTLGKRLDPNKTYYAVFELTDNFGKIERVRSAPIRTETMEEYAYTEALIIVNFEFNRTDAESKFQSARLDYVADKLIKRAMIPDTKVIATVGGHTDITGLAPRNRELSEQRAELELANLRKYLMYRLNLKSDAELTRWLHDHNVILRAQGYADARPFKVTVGTEQGFSEKLVGDNRFPEGRIVNRRVMLTLELKPLRKNKEGE